MPLLAIYWASVMRAAAWWVLLCCTILDMLLQNIPFVSSRGLGCEVCKLPL